MHLKKQEQKLKLKQVKEQKVKIKKIQMKKLMRSIK